jgi:hypothetical protein
LQQTSSSLSRGTIGNGADDESATQRLRQMTESLIQKQTIIESLQTDKNSLLLQLERLEVRMFFQKFSKFNLFFSVFTAKPKTPPCMQLVV